MNYQNYLEETRRVLLQSQRQKQAYTVQVLEEQFVVEPGVFSPRYFADTEIFAQMVPIKNEDAFLEIGCGIGAIGILAVMRGAKRALETDINCQAVRTAKRNVAIHGLEGKVEVRQGDLFSPLKKGERFSKIFWDVPFGYVTRKHLTLLERAVFDYRYEHIQKYLLEARAHLLPDGKVFIGFSSTLGRLDILSQMAKRAGSRLALIDQSESREGRLRVKFEFFEILQL